MHIRSFLVFSFCALNVVLNTCSSSEKKQSQKHTQAQTSGEDAAIAENMDTVSEIALDGIEESDEAASEFVLKDGVITDKRDGQTYKTVKIGRNVWMAENYNYKAAGSMCYENADSNCAKYGRLYRWEEALKNCPAGWHLPDRAEWNEIIRIAGDSLFYDLFAGSDSNLVAASMLKSKTGWDTYYIDMCGDDGGDDCMDSIAGSGGNGLGFSALPGGEFHNSHDKFYGIGESGCWWTSMNEHPQTTYGAEIKTGLNYVNMDVVDKKNGFSVRYVKNRSGQELLKESEERAAAALKARESISEFTDKRDGQKYKSVKIGNQLWMAENLKYKTDSMSYEKDEDGPLYTWYEAVSACPAGWHLPSAQECLYLLRTVSEGEDAGKKLKAKPPIWDGTDEYGFSATPLQKTPPERRWDWRRSFWTSTIHGRLSDDAYHLEFVVDKDDAKIDGFRNRKKRLCAVRCVADSRSTLK